MISALAMIVLRDWVSHKLRLGLTTAGIALGVAAFFAIQTTNDALVGSLNGTIEKLAGKATLQAAAGNAGFSFDAVKTVRSTPGVKIAEPVTETLAATTLGGTRLLILGLDTASDLQIYNSAADRSGLVIKNPLVFSSRKDSVAITTKLAERFGLKDGDKITVETSSGPAVLTVRGLFAASGIGDVYDGNVAVMDIYSAQETFGRGSRIDRIDISTDDGADVDAVQTELAARLGPGIDVVRPDLRGKSLENSVTTMHAGFTILSIVALMIGVFIIFNSFTISVNQRWKEIAIMRSIGVERRPFAFEPHDVELRPEHSGAGDVGQHPLPRGGSDLTDRQVQAERGQLGHHRVGRRDDRVLVGDVHREAQEFPAVLCGQRRRCLLAPAFVCVGDDDVVSVGGQACGDGGADAGARGCGDEGHLVVGHGVLLGRFRR